MKRRLALLWLLIPFFALSAQARLVPGELAAFRINRITMENPQRTVYRRLTVLGKDDRGETVPLYRDEAPGAREQLVCSLYLDDSIAQIIVELVPELGRPEIFTLKAPAGGYRIGVYGAPVLLDAPYIRREHPGQLGPGDVFVDSGELAAAEISKLLSAGIHCLSPNSAVREAGRYEGALIPTASSNPGEIERVLAAEQRELVRFKAAYYNLIGENMFYGIPNRESPPRFSGGRPEDIAATLARDSLRWRLTGPQILAAALFYAAGLIIVLLVRRPRLLLALLTAGVLVFFLILLRVPAREHLLVIELNPASLDAPELYFKTPGGGKAGIRSTYRAETYSENAPLLAYRQLYSFRKRSSLAPLAAAAIVRINQIPLIRNEGGTLFLEYEKNPLKVWTVEAPYARR